QRLWQSSPTEADRRPRSRFWELPQRWASDSSGNPHRLRGEERGPQAEPYPRRTSTPGVLLLRGHGDVGDVGPGDRRRTRRPEAELHLRRVVLPRQQGERPLQTSQEPAYRLVPPDRRLRRRRLPDPER